MLRHRPHPNPMCAWAWVFAGLLGLIGGRAPAAELSIAVSRSSLSLPLFVAEAQRFFAAEGLDVRLQECLGGHRCIQQMLSGEVALATSSEMPVMVNALTRQDFAIVTTFAVSKRDVKLVARRSAGIRGPEDLRGKRIATFEGTSAHYFLDLYLLFNGVDPKAVTPVMLTPERVVAALVDRQVDAIAVFEPFGYRAQRLLGADALVLPSTRVYTETFNLSALRTLIDRREGDLVRLMRALARAQRFIRERPQEARAILLQRLGEEPGYLDATWDMFDYRLSLDQSLLTTLEGQARWAVREGHAPADRRVPNFLRLIAPQPLRRADAAAVTLID